MREIRVNPTVLLKALIVGAIVIAAIVVVENARRGQHVLDLDSYDLQPIASATSFVLLVCGLMVTILHYQHTRAAQYIERFNDQSKFICRHAVDVWAREYVDEFGPELRDPRLRAADAKRDFAMTVVEQRLLQELREDLVLLTNVKAFANFFQELGQAYLSYLADRRYTARMFGFLAPHYWGVLHFWIEDYRRRNSTLYKRFELMASRMAARAEGSEGLQPRSRWAAWVTDLRRDIESRQCYVFAYGSLLNEHSLRSAVAASDGVAPSVASLRGFARCWQALETVELRDGGSLVQGIFLDLVISPGSECNGLLVPVSGDSDLRRLDEREDKYARVNVTRWVRSEALSPSARVYAYVALPEHTLRVDGDQAVDRVCRLARYEELVRSGVRQIDARHEGFADAFDRTTLPPNGKWEVVEDAYRFLAPAQRISSGQE